MLVAVVVQTRAVAVCAPLFALGALLSRSVYSECIVAVVVLLDVSELILIGIMAEVVCPIRHQYSSYLYY